MKKITAVMLVSITMTVGMEALRPKVANAQLFYPPASDRHSLMVMGQGVVRVPADTADIELVVSSKNSNEELQTQPSTLSQVRRVTLPVLLLNTKTPIGQIPPTPALESQKPLTKANLQPIIDSLVTNGISADKIQVQVNPNSTENNAKILVRVEKPTRDRIHEIVGTANKATSKLENLTINNVGVEYAVNDCQALQSSVYQSAMKDAQSRAQALATAMGVKLGAASVAEPFYTLFYPSCNSKSGVTLPSFASFLLTPTYDPDAPAEVEMKKDIFVTYTVK
ncbi:MULTISPECIES: SIMPL domain-containing protein [Nostoc]|uniref:SIMPL domain-containing protein n=1 Tax=Nostoc paludosum FACHB-159 TaxID=2692908 RepID=A0ABR8K3J5_9NOSO|nr:MULTISPECIES: SIMPL domain-containing protein [Nostoc]MBD2678303.1 SIMPL domain-containing protein [Nostoc sp. FACHB-857]MBD2733421.1 SIMPL domain-containing protein [Nostoc paludosum FACHB-159]